MPYDYSFVDGSLDKYKQDGWVLNGKLRVSNESLTFCSKTLVLNHYRTVFDNTKEKGFVVSPQFILPEGVEQLAIQPSVQRRTYHSGGKNERTGYIGVTANQSTSNTSSVSYKSNGGNVNKQCPVDGKDAWLNNITLTRNTPYVSVDCNEWTSGICATYYFLHEVHLRYAE